MTFTPPWRPWGFRLELHSSAPAFLLNRDRVEAEENCRPGTHRVTAESRLTRGCLVKHSSHLLGGRLLFRQFPHLSFPSVASAVVDPGVLVLVGQDVDLHNYGDASSGGELRLILLLLHHDQLLPGTPSVYWPATLGGRQLSRVLRYGNSGRLVWSE